MNAQLASKSDWRELLASLRWDADMLVTNPFNEQVWLKPCYDESGKRIGITDCCPEEAPCGRHAGRKLNLTEKQVLARTGARLPA
jgi:hypothetical protein